MEEKEGLFYDYLEAFVNEDGELEFELHEVQVTDLDPSLFFGEDEQ